MKTEELLRYQAMYRAMKERFRARFVEYGFAGSNGPEEKSNRVEDRPYEAGAQEAEGGSRVRDRL